MRVSLLTIYNWMDDLGVKKYRLDESSYKRLLELIRSWSWKMAGYLMKELTTCWWSDALLTGSFTRAKIKREYTCSFHRSRGVPPEISIRIQWPRSDHRKMNAFRWRDWMGQCLCPGQGHLLYWFPEDAVLFRIFEWHFREELFRPVRRFCFFLLVWRSFSQIISSIKTPCSCDRSR